MECIRFCHYSRHSHPNWPLSVHLPRYHKTHDAQKYRGPFSNFHENISNYPNLHIPGSQSRTPRYHMRLHGHPTRTVSRHFRHSPKVLSSGNYQVLRASGLQHWFKNWQESRRLKLTASTFGGAVGFWRGRRVQLWLEKLGKIDPFAGNLATCWSNIQEEVALERYKLITGNSVSFTGFELCDKVNPADDWLAASPDGMLDRGTYGLLSGGVLEIKCPFFSGEVERALPWSRIPLHYMPQAQGLMEILDRNWMDFYVWTPNGSSLFRLERDQQYWELLKLSLSDFWWKHVQPAKELLQRAPFKEVWSLKPAPRHELCDTIVYGSRCLVDDAKLLVREIHGRMMN